LPFGPEARVGIDDGDVVIRFVNPQAHLADEVRGKRLSSAIFAPSSDDGLVSIEVEKLLRADGLSAQDRLIDERQGLGAIRLIAGNIRALGFDVIHDPICAQQPFGPNPYHGAITNVTKQGHRKKLLRESGWSWVVKPAGVP
jgi:hypothetical protein